jgi:hypothetical protein
VRHGTKAFFQEIIMPVKDEFSKSRSIEDEHFRKKDAEWTREMKKRAELGVECGRMGEAIGVADPKILLDIQALGYTRETVKLLYLAPLVCMAWVEGDVTQRELKRILEVAQLRGIEESSLAYSRLTEWLTERPRQEFLEGTLSVIRDLITVMPVEQGRAIKEDLVSCCTHVAATSGGLLGLGRAISATAQALLKQIADALEQPQDAAANQPAET